MSSSWLPIQRDGVVVAGGDPRPLPALVESCRPVRCWMQAALNSQPQIRMTIAISRHTRSGVDDPFRPTRACRPIGPPISVDGPPDGRIGPGRDDPIGRAQRGGPGQPRLGVRLGVGFGTRPGLVAMTRRRRIVRGCRDHGAMLLALPVRAARTLDRPAPPGTARAPARRGPGDEWESHDDQVGDPQAAAMPTAACRRETAPTRAYGPDARRLAEPAGGFVGSSAGLSSRRHR